ncbi:MAG: pteridine reductase [Proteobacteria bacterium]|nr:pteridine reductase [Pseudomonadota bacterium]
MSKVVLITGAARRVGAQLARTFFDAGYRLVLHYNTSARDAAALKAQFDERRRDSVRLVQADLITCNPIEFARSCLAAWGQIDVLVNNASTFYATPIGSITMEHWEDLVGSNVRAPLFISQALAPGLKATRGSIINIVDIHGRKPLKGFTTYGIAKAGLEMMTRSLAVELAPEVRVNGIAPGAVMWPEDLTDTARNRIINKIPLARAGSATDIARTALFLANDAPYVTGQIIAVDGGRSIT